MIRLSVTVTGPPFAIWRLNSGITDPALLRTLPKRVALYFTFPWVLALWTIISHIRFVVPMTLVGLTALSVDTIMKRAAQLGSDGTAASGDQNDFIFIILVGSLVGNHQWFSEENFFDIKLSKMFFSSNIVHRRIIVYFQFIAGFFIILIQCFFLLCIHRRDREDDFLYFKLTQLFKCCLAF